MSETVTGGAGEAAPETCAQCSKRLSPGDRVPAGDRVFCRTCFDSLKADLRRAFGEMSTDVNYVNGTVGALIGGALGALVWWGFTVLTHFSWGLVAIAIGFLTGHGAVRLSGGKRSGGLQAISIAVSVVAFAMASYLVNMTLYNKAFADSGAATRVPFPPASVEQFVAVVSAGFGLMDLVFLAIVVYEAWKIPRPLPMPAELSA